MFQEIINPIEYRAGLYLRLSKEDDTSVESQSIINQKSLLEEFARKERLTVVDVYIDDGYSGTNFERPGFKRMVADIEAKKINMVITKDLSRLGRDYIMTGHYIEKYFPEHRVRYISMLDNIDTGIDSSINDITPFKAIINDMYAKDISKKIKSVKHDKVRKGLFIGSKPPYGYGRSEENKNKLVIDEESAKVVRRMFALALEGHSARSIAQTFSLEGIPTPATYAKIKLSKQSYFTGNWASERVQESLTNEVYIGNMVQGKIRKINYKSTKEIKVPREDWVIVKDTHEPIIDKETFDKVQLLVKQRRSTRSVKHDYPLKGLVYCHDCGGKMSAIPRKMPNGSYNYGLRCQTYTRYTKLNKCTLHYTPLHIIEEKVYGKLRDIFADYLDREKLFSRAERIAQGKSAKDKLDDELMAVKAKVEAINKMIDCLYNDKLSGTLAEDDFARIYEVKKKEKDELAERIVFLEDCQNADDGKEYTEKLKELVENFLSMKKPSKVVLASLIDKVAITEDKRIIVFFRFRLLQEDGQVTI